MHIICYCIIISYHIFLFIIIYASRQGRDNRCATTPDTYICIFNIYNIYCYNIYKYIYNFYCNYMYQRASRRRLWWAMTSATNDAATPTSVALLPASPSGSPISPASCRRNTYIL